MRRMSNRTIQAGLFLVFIASFVIAAGRLSAADAIRPCRILPIGVSTFSRLDDAPLAVAQALTKRVGEVVPVDAPFDSTDVVRVGKSRRLIFIWNAGTTWVVATEHGGLGYNDPVFAFGIDRPDGNQVTFLGEEIAHPDTVCSTAISLIAVNNPTKVGPR